MEKMDLKTIAEWVNGELHGDNVIIESISTDSRHSMKNTLFIPLRGERFDGHTFIEDAEINGAIAFISENIIETVTPYLLVSNTLLALGDIAKHYIRQFKSTKIIITGSTGKTSFKDLLFECLITDNKIKTAGNTNNLIGTPLNLLRIDGETEYAVIEAGMNTQGELLKQSIMIKPDYVIITSINNSHIGMFDSFEALVKAKLEILVSASKEHPLLINGDNQEVLDSIPSEIAYTTFGIKSSNEYYPSSITLNSRDSIVKFHDKEFRINVPGMGAVNMITGIYAFISENPHMSLDLEKGLLKYCAPEKRLNVLDTGKFIIIDDSYNASPASMRNALDVLNRFKGRKVAILADMLELGKDSKTFHNEIGDYILSKEIDIICSFGNDAKYFSLKHKNGIHFNNKKELSEYLLNTLENDDVILIKGSRSMKMEEITNIIKGGFNAL